eukprot:107750-Pyramimonas_sp.AAC.2
MRTYLPEQQSSRCFSKDALAEEHVRSECWAYQRRFTGRGHAPGCEECELRLPLRVRSLVERSTVMFARNHGMCRTSPTLGRRVCSRSSIWFTCAPPQTPTHLTGYTLHRPDCAVVIKRQRVGAFSLLFSATLLKSHKMASDARHFLYTFGPAAHSEAGVACTRSMTPPS